MIEYYLTWLGWEWMKFAEDPDGYDDDTSWPWDEAEEEVLEMQWTGRNAFILVF